MKKALLVIFLTTWFSSCIDDSPSQGTCSKGKFVGFTCSGFLIEPLEGDLLAEYMLQYPPHSSYRAFVTASIDESLVPSDFDARKFFTADSIFYFSHKKGAFHTETYCSDLAATITILTISDSACGISDSD